MSENQRENDKREKLVKKDKENNQLKKMRYVKSAIADSKMNIPVSISLLSLTTYLYCRR